MQCRRCKVDMGTGTTYEQRKGDDKLSARRFYECKKCNDRVYTKEPNFQEIMAQVPKKNRSR